jgi:hypothetical protein
VISPLGLVVVEGGVKELPGSRASWQECAVQVVVVVVVGDSLTRFLAECEANP